MYGFAYLHIHGYIIIWNTRLDWHVFIKAEADSKLNVFAIMASTPDGDHGAKASTPDGFAASGCCDMVHRVAPRRQPFALERASANDDLMTVAALEVVFFVDRIGFFLGEECLVLRTLSSTIEATACDE